MGVAFQERGIAHREMGRPIVQYDTMFDAVKYQALLELDNTYQDKKEALNASVSFNLRTALSERFHTGISTRVDLIEDHVMKSLHTREPLLEMFERGRKYRAAHGSSLSDQARETAEVIGFAKIQKLLCNPHTRAGTMVLSISPPGNEGSIYTHNFYDIFTLKEKGGVEVSRYSSALGAKEALKKIQQLYPFYDLSEQASDVSFLANPIRISPEREVKSAKDVHRFLHKEHAYMDQEAFEEIVQLCLPYIHHYLSILSQNPFDREKIGKAFDALLNKADEVAGLGSRRPSFVFNETFPDEFTRLESQRVREVATGCGRSVGSQGSFSVVEFGESSDDYGERSFPCPSCGRKNLRPYNKMLSRCQNRECPNPTAVACG